MRRVHDGDAVLEQIRGSIEEARSAGAPIVYLQHAGSEDGVFARGSAGWELHPAIAFLEGEAVVEKHTADAFVGTGLEESLKQLSVGAVVICGFVTEGCVDTTVRRASSLGFEIELASDAHSTTDGEVLTASQTVRHHNAVLAIFSDVKAAREIRFS